MSYPSQFVLIVDDRAFGPFPFDEAASQLFTLKEHDRLAFLAPFHPAEELSPYLLGHAVDTGDVRRPYRSFADG